MHANCSNSSSAVQTFYLPNIYTFLMWPWYYTFAFRQYTVYSFIETMSSYFLPYYFHFNLNCKAFTFPHSNYNTFRKVKQVAISLCFSKRKNAELLVSTLSEVEPTIDLLPMVRMYPVKRSSYENKTKAEANWENTEQRYAQSTETKQVNVLNKLWTTLHTHRDEDTF